MSVRIWYTLISFCLLLSGCNKKFAALKVSPGNVSHSSSLTPAPSPSPSSPAPAPSPSSPAPAPSPSSPAPAPSPQPQGSEPAPSPTPTVLSHPAVGAQKTIILYVNFSDSVTKNDYFTTPDYTWVSGTLDQVNSFIRENSYGQTWLTGVVHPGQEADVFGPVTVSADSTTCGTSSYADALNKAYAAGVNVSVYDRVILVTPPDNGCSSQGGDSYIGKLSLFVGGGIFSASVTHIGGQGHFNLAVVAHEVGHALGLYHSHNIAKGSVTYDKGYEYGDNFDEMGDYWCGMHFNAFQKERLGWLGSTSGNGPWMSTVMHNGTYTIEGYAIQSNGLKALKILGPNDPTRGQGYFYAQYHSMDGWDSGGGSSLAGIDLHHAYSDGDSSVWLAMATNKGLMLPTDSFSSGGVTIEVLSFDATSATVKVSGLL